MKSNAAPKSKKVALFVDRDGTIIVEPPVDYQVDSFEKLQFVPGAISALRHLRRVLPHELVMVTNQDGLGTDSFPEERFWGPHNLMLNTLRGEGVEFDDILIDRSFPEDNAPTRKPALGMLGAYLTSDYDLDRSWVIGDRLTDAQLAKNLGAQAIVLAEDTPELRAEIAEKGLTGTVKMVTPDWWEAVVLIQGGVRQATVHRKTAETDIEVSVNLDGTGSCDISTGIGMLDHMLEQIGRHGQIDLTVHAHGDLHVDHHHTIEDTALTLGEALGRALGDKRGIERYGFVLPMDDCLATVAIDFGGRPWLVMEAEWDREAIGGFPTEMIYHFFKSLSDAARINLYISAKGDNEHHKLEAIFKGLARSLRRAVRRDPEHFTLPSTKGTL
ncbi:MAG: bifunctional histidinol-phosphatase/imidazoleglycerol-phosphate dehydratase HisB [Bacteroidales bacterium]|nr:bifunctional histidinol-phosphatase/imidazoleglycerol-phosphate dehydratase HisB [Bacteroidales bacterium]MCD8393782.1 bifunctional histidinol-phosphatase/imidazoleglycerol-phosphate dehydratase HisB [Bacteroidales bacterium]